MIISYITIRNNVTMRPMIIIPEPAFNSRLTDLIVELEGLRNHPVRGTTKPWIFYEIKQLFHIVEALSSARIEGNHTTLAAYIDAQMALDINDPIQEIKNIIDALEFIDQHVTDIEISKQFILELHKIVVKNLIREGDDRPGAYRKDARSIAGSKHVLPQPSDINDLMNELFRFINMPTDKKQDLIKISVAHHRFVWIHPFGNGNGRVVRLLTYAMLCEAGFITPGLARLFNPAAVFAGDRREYYRMLEKADTGTREAIIDWCEYVLEGIRVEVEKSQKLTNEKFVNEQILLPTIQWGVEMGILAKLDKDILDITIKKKKMKAADIRKLWPDNVSHVTISKHLRKLKEQNYIKPLKKSGREYSIRMIGNKLTRGYLSCMEREGLLPLRLDELDEAKYQS